MMKVGIVGISGYSGGILLKVLLNHPRVRVTYVSANNTQGKIEEIWPQLRGRTDLYCGAFDAQKAVQLCDIIFLAVPHGVSMMIAPKLLKAKKRVIDLSGDYRLQNAKIYHHWYGIKHTDTINLKKAVYGLPELYREKIKTAALVSNPGCYPTAAIIALAPLMTAYADEIRSVIIDAKSGVSGAGKKVTPAFIFSEVNENFKAYKVLNHQHTPEINRYLSNLARKTVEITFVPHLLPITRGILETIYVQAKHKSSFQKTFDVYRKFYKTERFVRILPENHQSELKSVVGTNFCDLALVTNEDKDLLVITAAIDNLMKGASGQAVQNMNIMFGYPETEGLL